MSDNGHCDSGLAPRTTLLAATVEARRKPLAPPEITGSICGYGTCTLDPVFEQDTPIGRQHFCEPHSDEMALDVVGLESV